MQESQNAKIKRLRYEAYLDWLNDKTKGMSDSSVLHTLNNNQMISVSREELDPYLLELCFPSIFDQNSNGSFNLVKALNYVIQWKLSRIELGEFYLENPYERFCKIKFRDSNCFKAIEKVKFVDQNESYIRIHEEIQRDLEEKRRSIEEQCYVEILCNQGTLSEEEILDAVDEFCSTGALIISPQVLEKAVQIKYLAELRRVNSMYE
jgi:hypothetical protein